MLKYNTFLLALVVVLNAIYLTVFAITTSFYCGTSNILLLMDLNSYDVHAVQEKMVFIMSMTYLLKRTCSNTVKETGFWLLMILLLGLSFLQEVRPYTITSLCKQR